MTLDNYATASPHIFQHFDAELGDIHHLAIDMLNLIVNQWELAIEGIEDANFESALSVIARKKDINHYETIIDQAILTLLAKESPVAGDLRMVLSISKISVVMKYLGDEAVEIAKLTLSLYEPRNGTPHAHLVRDIINISQSIRIVLGNLVIVLGNFESQQAHLLLRHSREFGLEIMEAVKHQLAIIHHDLRQIRPVLTILQIMNSLEMCVDHCKNLTEYSIFMIDGLDVRHLN